MKKIILSILIFLPVFCIGQVYTQIYRQDTLWLKNLTQNDSVQLNRLPRVWGSFIGNLSDQTDLQTALNNKLSTATAAGTYATSANLAAKQDALVSGTNIKTVNGTSLIGSGNVVISGGSSYRTLYTLASNVINSTTSYANVTGLSFDVTSGVTYRFFAFIPYTSAATTTGSRWSVTGPANTLLHYTSRYALTATAQTQNFATAYDIPAAANATSLTAGNVAMIEGFVRPSANGTVTIRFASEVAASAITALAGGTLEVW